MVNMRGLMLIMSIDYDWAQDFSLMIDGMNLVVQILKVGIIFSYG